MISSMSLFWIINGVVFEPRSFFLITVSASNAAAVNPNGNKTISANSVNTLWIKLLKLF